MSKLGQLVREARERHDLTQPEVAHHLNLKRPISISKWENGEAPIPWHHFLGLMQLLEIPQNKFLEMARREIPTAVLAFERYIQSRHMVIAEEKPSYARPALPRGVRLVPVLNEAACGKWRDFTDLEFPPGHADRHELAPTTDQHAFYVVATGDSMIGAEIKEGDLLLVEPSKRVDDGHIVLANVADKGVTVKKFFRHDGHIELRPMNERHKSLIVKDDPSLRVLRITRIVKQV